MKQVSVTLIRSVDNKAQIKLNFSQQFQ